MLTIIGLGFRGKYVRAGNFNLTMTLIGLAIVLPSLLFYIHQRNNRNKKIAKERADENKEFQDFLKNSNKTILKLKDVEIISFDGKNIDTFNSLVSQIEESKNRNEEPISRKMVIRFPYKNQNLVYFFDTRKNLYDIKTRFELKKETYVYERNGDIYVDTSFLG